jgi:hypothetical protein
MSPVPRATPIVVVDQHVVAVRVLHAHYGGRAGVVGGAAAGGGAGSVPAGLPVDAGVGVRRPDQQW